jgi:signal peptidase I
MKRSAYAWALLLALSPLAFVHPVRVEGGSMEPTLRDGQVLLALWPWCSGKPALGEVWTIEDLGSPGGPAGMAIKRVLALPGQTLEQRNGYLIRDGAFVEEPYVSFRDTRHGGPWPAGSGYLLLGDNRPASRDCRQWGAVGMDGMGGRVVGM